MRSSSEITLQALQLHDVFRRARALAHAETSCSPCPPSCTRCCSAGFDVGSTDTVVALERLRRLEPETRKKIMERLRQAIEAEDATLARLGIQLPEGVPPSLSTLGEEALDDLCDALLAVPCPFLEPQSSACLLGANAPEPCHLRGHRWVDREDAVWELDMRCDETEHVEDVLAVPLKAQQRAAARLLADSTERLRWPPDERFPWARALLVALSAPTENERPRNRK